MYRKRLHHQLEMQTLEIQEVLARHEVEAEVALGHLQVDYGRQKVSFDVRGQLTKGWERLQALKRDLKQVFGSADVRLEQDDDHFRVNLFHNDRPPVELLEILDYLVELPPLTAVLGWSVDNRPVLLDLKLEETCHAFIAGIQASGKTNLLRSIALSLALANKEPQVQLIIIDPTQRFHSQQKYEHSELRAFTHLPHLLSPLVNSGAAAADMLEFLVSESKHRTHNNISQPAIVVLIDQIDMLLQEEKGGILRPLNDLIIHGSKVGMHLILSSSRPEDKSLQELLESYIPARLVGQMVTAEQAEIATEMLDSQAERLQGKGEFLAIANGLITQFQAAYVSDYDVHLSIDQMQRYRPPSLLAQAFEDAPKLNLREPSITYQITIPSDGKEKIPFDDVAEGTTDEKLEGKAVEVPQEKISSDLTEKGLNLSHAEVVEEISEPDWLEQSAPVESFETQKEPQDNSISRINETIKTQELNGPNEPSNAAAFGKLPTRYVNNLIERIVANYSDDEETSQSIQAESLSKNPPDSSQTQKTSDDKDERFATGEMDHLIPFTWESPRLQEVVTEKIAEAKPEENEIDESETTADLSSQKITSKKEGLNGSQIQTTAEKPKSASVKASPDFSAAVSDEDVEPVEINPFFEKIVKDQADDASDLVYEDVDEWLDDFGPNFGEDWEVQATLDEEGKDKADSNLITEDEEEPAENQVNLGSGLKLGNAKPPRLRHPDFPASTIVKDEQVDDD